MTNMDPRIAFFNAQATGWDDQGPSAEAMIAHLARHGDLLGLRPGLRLLEVGCGTGKTTAWLAEQVRPGRVTAVDFAPEMLVRARAKSIDARFACVDACCDDLGPGPFDVILCFHSFPHFRDQPAALRNFRNALAPDGRLLVMHLAGSDHINRFHASVNGAVKGDVLPAGEQWTPLLAAAGLRQVRLIDREELFFLEAVPLG